MIIVVAAILAVLTVPLMGRSLAPLANLPLKRVWLVWLSIGLQVAIISVFELPNWLGTTAAPHHLCVVGGVPVEQPTPPGRVDPGPWHRLEPGRDRCQRRDDAGVGVGLSQCRVGERRDPVRELERRPRGAAAVARRRLRHPEGLAACQRVQRR